MPKQQKTRSKEETTEKQQKKHQFTLYDLLEVTEKATTEEIRKQYKILVLKYHPDKNKEDVDARQKFQKLKQAYDILINPYKRKQYDETGTFGDDFNSNSFQSAYEYFRSMFKKVTEEDIHHFEKEYRHGKMEQEDLLDYYQKNKGNMVALLESIPLSQNQDVKRFVKFYQEKIDSKLITKYKIFDSTKKKIRLLKDQSKEFEELQKQEKQEKQKELSQLVLAIRNKNSNQKGFLDSLEEKYGLGKKKKMEKVEKVQKVKKEGEHRRETKK